MSWRRIYICCLVWLCGDNHWRVHKIGHHDSYVLQASLRVTQNVDNERSPSTIEQTLKTKVNLSVRRKRLNHT